MVKRYVEALCLDGQGTCTQTAYPLLALPCFTGIYNICRKLVAMVLSRWRLAGLVVAQTLCWSAGGDTVYSSLACCSEVG